MSKYKWYEDRLAKLRAGDAPSPAGPPEVAFFHLFKTGSYSQLGEAVADFNFETAYMSPDDYWGADTSAYAKPLALTYDNAHHPLLPAGIFQVSAAVTAIFASDFTAPVQGEVFFGGATTDNSSGYLLGGPSYYLGPNTMRGGIISVMTRMQQPGLLVLNLIGPKNVSSVTLVDAWMTILRIS